MWGKGQERWSKVRRKAKSQRRSTVKKIIVIIIYTYTVHGVTVVNCLSKHMGLTDSEANLLS